MTYVVSQDICRLLSAWAQPRGFQVPDGELMREIRASLKQSLMAIFGANKVDMLPAEMISAGIHSLTEDLSLTLASLERAYHHGAVHDLALNRTVDEQLQDRGISHRFGSQPLEHQIQAIAASGIRELALVDDVIFSGKGLLSIINLLAMSGIRVPIVITGIAVGAGCDRLKRHGIEVRHVVYYSDVRDEVCERDFFPGVPLSGRSLSGARRDVGVPYIEPFGKPTEWASIPEHHSSSFSRNCLQQTVRLWEEIERLSERAVCCCDLERLPLGAPHDGTRFAEYLHGLN